MSATQTTTHRGETLADRLGRRLRPLDAGRLLAEATRKTGLTDFGYPPVQPALSILVRSLDREASLHPIGRLAISSHLADMLATRLRLVDTWKRGQTPLESVPIARPLFITGMPRSGSTFLHELLAADPGNRVPRVWEVMFPVAPEGGDTRYRRAASRLWWFRRLAPEADSVHPLRAGSPQECEAIHSYTFLSEEFLSTCSVPSYEAWLRSSDFVPVYAWQKKFLQHLQGAESGPRWVLKSPDHAHTMAALLAVFPDAVIVQTHREPAEVLASSLRLVEVLHGTFARPDGRPERVEREARVLADAMERLLKFREAHPELVERFVDVSYPELIANPVQTVGRIYGRWGGALEPEAVEAMRRLTARRSRYPRGSAAPDRGGNGRSLGADMRRFDRYRQRFGLPVPP